MRVQIVCALLFALIIQANGQITISGMVVDSVSLEPLPETSIKLKRAGTGVVTDSRGRFKINAGRFDTLQFSRIGYQIYEYPLIDSDEDLLILIREEVQKLKEVVVDVYDDEKPVHTAPRVVKPLSLANGISSPFTYFSKAEKEKRVLVRLQKEQQKVQVYVDLITRERFKHDMIDELGITEDQYYEILAKFNTENRKAHYLTDEEAIKAQLLAYFRNIIDQ